jgi:hypothetical protein
MRFRVTFKTPDVLDTAIANIGEWNENDEFIPMDEYERETIYAKCSKFVRYGELITIEFSDEDGEFEARVVPA